MNRANERLMSDLPQTPHLRGFTVANTVQWVQRAYGEPILQRALNRLPPHERIYFQRSILSMGWYPFSAWEHFLDATYAEIGAITGEDTDALDYRNFREGAGTTMRTIYKFFFSFMEPVSTLARLGSLFPRVYSHGCSELLENRQGFSINRCTVPEEMRHNIKRTTRHGIVYVLELVGARDVRVEITRDEAHPTLPGNWIVETSTRYRV
jgi:hypothetical protein